MIGAETAWDGVGLWSWLGGQRQTERSLLGGAGLAWSASSVQRWRLCLSRDPGSSIRRREASPAKGRRRADLVDAWFALVFVLLIVEVSMVCSGHATVDWWVAEMREVDGAIEKQ